MKFLLVFLLVLVVAWRWRAWREAVLRNKPRQDPPIPTAANMVTCKHCGLHIPEKDALIGKLGNYCSAEHRHQVEN